MYGLTVLADTFDQYIFTVVQIVQECILINQINSNDYKITVVHVLSEGNCKTRLTRHLRLKHAKEPQVNEALLLHQSARDDALAAIK